MKKISRLLAGIAAAALLGTSISATALASGEEVLKQFFGYGRQVNFYETGDSVAGSVCLQKATSGQALPDGSAASSTNFSLKLKITNDTDTAQTYQHWANVSTPDAKNCYSVTDTDTTALQFQICLANEEYGKALKNFQVGLACHGAETSSKNLVYGTLTTDITSLIDTTKTGVWQEVTVPVSDIQKGTFQANELTLPEFDWSKVSGISFAVENQGVKNVGYLNPALYLCDMKLVKLSHIDPPDPVTEAKVKDITFRDGAGAQITGLTNQDSVTADVTLEHPANSGSAVVVIASYTGAEGNYALRNVSVKNEALTAEQTVVSTDQIAVSQEETLVKVFVWQNFSNLKPWEITQGLVNTISR